MKLRAIFLFVVSFALHLARVEAAGTLVSGPMLGYQAHREALIWVETKNAHTLPWITGAAASRKPSRALPKPI